MDAAPAGGARELRHVRGRAGGSRRKLSDVAKFTLYVVDHDKEKFRIIQEEFGPVWGDRKPAWTLAPVPALALEGMLVEIDVIAVVPA